MDPKKKAENPTLPPSPPHPTTPPECDTPVVHTSSFVVLSSLFWLLLAFLQEIRSGQDHEHAYWVLSLPMAMTMYVLFIFTSQWLSPLLFIFLSSFGFTSQVLLQNSSSCKKIIKNYKKALWSHHSGLLIFNIFMLCVICSKHRQ